jgi:hypothetical protein
LVLRHLSSFITITANLLKNVSDTAEALISHTSDATTSHALWRGPIWAGRQHKHKMRKQYWL